MRDPFQHALSEMLRFTLQRHVGPTGHWISFIEPTSQLFVGNNAILMLLNSYPLYVHPPNLPPCGRRSITPADDSDDFKLGSRRYPIPTHRFLTYLGTAHGLDSVPLRQPTMYAANVTYPTLVGLGVLVLGS
jgi:hypothetical protein